MTAGLNCLIQRFRENELARSANSVTDVQLLDCFISERDEAAFAALAQRHGPMVWGVCRRMLADHHDAEDALQATFMVLARKAASVKPRNMIANWLYGVACQIARKARAIAVRRKAREKQMLRMPDVEVTDEGDWRDLQPVLDDEIRRLPNKYRLPIILCDLESKTRKEAAYMLGWPEGTIAGRLARGRQLLAKRLTRRGVTLSVQALAMLLTSKAASACFQMIPKIPAATLLSAGHAVPNGFTSSNSAALTQKVLNTMLLSKLRFAMGTLVLAIITGSFTLLFTSTNSLDGKTQSDRKAAFDEHRKVQPANVNPNKAEREHLEIFRIGKSWEKAGILSQKDYVILRQMGKIVQQKGIISDRDLNWLIDLLRESKQAVVCARILTMFSALRKATNAQRQTIVQALKSFLKSKNALERNAANRASETMNRLQPDDPFGQSPENG